MSYRFDDHWVTETLRLRESLWGPLEDAAESGKARAQNGSFESRLLTRSTLLARREGLDTTLSRWRQSARLALLLFALAALIAGGCAAAGALGRGGNVNVALAVTALLGLNTLTFLLWLASFGMRGGNAGSLLANAWLKLTRKLARGPDAALLPRALLELFSRQGVQRWGAGVLTHGLWALALLAALLTLLALLATRRYAFHWETTLLSPDAFVAMVHGLGLLPSLLGFPLPAADTIRVSSGLHSLPESAQTVWSAWLIGLVVVYGLLPRLLALGISLFIMRRRLARLEVDASLPGIAELHERLMPSSITTGIDAPAPAVQPGHVQPVESTQSLSQRCLLGLELPPDLDWPPHTLPPGVSDLGVIDTREQRHRLLDALRREPARRLLVCCDARQTPDRGSLALLQELASLSHDMRLALLPEDDAPSRREQWQRQLLQGGFTPEQLQARLDAGLQWLAGQEDRHGEPAA